MCLGAAWQAWHQRSFCCSAVPLRAIGQKPRQLPARLLACPQIYLNCLYNSSCNHAYLPAARRQREVERAVHVVLQARGMGTVLDQFGNPDNPLGHYRGTGPELWEQTQGRITHFVSSMGTTGASSLHMQGGQGHEAILRR